jgi:hypothetical protein
MESAPTSLVEIPKGLATSSLAAGSRPRPIVPTDIDQVWRLSVMVVKSGLAPKSLETAEKVCIAMMHGLEIGMPPMMSLQRIAVINGRPAVWGDGVPGVALGTGLVEDWFETIQGDGDNMVATCRVKRKGVKSPAERTFSVADAKRAGLWDTREKVTRRKKDGTTYEARNDSPWFRFPKRMLIMRARVAFRDLFSDALGGLYIAEELDEDDGVVAPMKDVTPAKVAVLPPVVTQKQATAEEEIEADPEDEVVDGEAEEAEAEMAKLRAASTGKPLPPVVRARSSAETADLPLDPTDATKLKAGMRTDIAHLFSASDFAHWLNAAKPMLDRLSPADRAEIDAVFQRRQDEVRG